MEERRKAQRGRTLKGGSITFNRASGIDCRVRNKSSVGACIEVSSQVDIPSDFVLKVSYDKFRQTCVLAWNFVPLRAPNPR